MSENDKNEPTQEPEPEEGAPSTEAQDGPETEPTEEPRNDAPRSLRGAGLRYADGDDVPSWAQGRTADEILDIASQLYDSVQRGSPTPSSTPNPPSAPTPQPNVNSQPSDGIPSVDPNLIYSNPKEYHRQMEQRTQALINQSLSQAEGRVSSPIASLAKTQAMQHRPDVWKRYGPEIEAAISQISPSLRGNVDVLKTAVDLVAGKHVDELADARMKDRMARGDDAGMLETSGGPPSPKGSGPRDPIDALFAEEAPAVQGFLDDRISSDQVKAYASARGYTHAEYADMLKERAARGAAR